MSTVTNRTRSKVKTIAVYLAVICSLLMVLVPAGLVWHSQIALEKLHLTEAGAIILLWNNGEPIKYGMSADYSRGSFHWLLSQEDLTMTPAAAAFLAKFHNNYLNLSLLHLTPAVAKGLSQTNSGLNFSNLEITSPEMLSGLVSGSCPSLRIPIPNLTAAEAEALSQFKGESLTGTKVGQLSPQAAKALGRCGATKIQLEQLDKLSEEAAVGLAQCGAKELKIGSLESISADTATALSQFQGDILTLSMTHISEEAAVALGQYPGHLWLLSLQTLPDEAAHALADRKLLKVGYGAWNGPHKLDQLPASAAAILREADNNSE